MSDCLKIALDFEIKQKLAAIALTFLLNVMITFDDAKMLNVYRDHYKCIVIY